MPRPATTLSLFDDTKPLVIVAYYNYDGISVEGAIASVSSEWMGHRGFIRACFSYVFDSLKCRRFVVRVEDTNQRALAFDKKLGFVHEGTLRQASTDGHDVHILGMLKNECRWINGREKHAESANAA